MRKRFVQAVLSAIVLAVTLGCFGCDEYDSETSVNTSVRDFFNITEETDTFAETTGIVSAEQVAEETPTDTPTQRETSDAYAFVEPEPPETALVAETVAAETYEAEKNAVYVWIPVNGGKKYHSNKSCSNMKDPENVPLDEAVRMGYTPCKRCF